MVIYVPGTEETDPKKQNMSLQQLGAAATANTTNIAAWPGTTIGQLPFPASQAPSADANTLDDYEEGTWTPVVTFSTPGNLAVTYSLQKGYYTKIGRLVAASFGIVTSAFTYTTASGNMIVTGLPFPSVNDASYRSFAPVIWDGINKATYSAIMSSLLGNTSTILIQASGMGVGAANVVTTDAPTGSGVVLGGCVNYVVG